MSSIGLIRDVLDPSTQYSIACFLRDRLLTPGLEKPVSTEVIRALAEVLETSNAKWLVSDIFDSFALISY